MGADTTLAGFPCLQEPPRSMGVGSSSCERKENREGPFGFDVIRRAPTLIKKDEIGPRKQQSPLMRQLDVQHRRRARAAVLGMKSA